MKNEYNKNKFETNFSVRQLNDEQLDAVLPNWNDIFDKIDTCRKAAKVENLSENSKTLSDFALDILEHTKACNVFSIFGGRGTGKSSVLYTLRKKLIENSQKTGDIVLPLVLPEIIDSDNTLIGWVLSSLKPIVEKLDKYKRQFKKRNYRNK